MRSLVKIMFVLVLVALVGFTLVINEDKITEPVVTEDLVSVEEETVTADRSLVEFIDKGTMKASWYGPGFHGQKTANGEIYNQNSFYCSS